MKKLLIPLICASLLLTGFIYDPDKVVKTGSCRYMSNEGPFNAIDTDGLITIYGEGEMGFAEYHNYDYWTGWDPSDPNRPMPWIPDHPK